MHVLRRPLLVLTTLVVAACASAGQGGDDRPRRDPNVITSEEMVDWATHTVFEVIQTLRPRWLQGRGNSSIEFGGENTPSVLFDNQLVEFSSLRMIRSADIELLRWVSARDATTRFGTGYANGLIEVVTLRDF